LGGTKWYLVEASRISLVCAIKLSI